MVDRFVERLERPVCRRLTAEEARGESTAMWAKDRKMYGVFNIDFLSDL